MRSMRTAADGDEEERLRRRARTGSYTALAGVVGFTVCLLVRFSTVLPRWDLLAMLAVVGVGAAIRMHALRARVLNSVDPRHMLRPDVPPVPPGFRIEKRLWWPDRKSMESTVVLLLCAVPLVLLAYSASNTTAVLDRVRGSDHTVVRGTVTHVEARKAHQPKVFEGGHRDSVFTYDLRVNTRADRTGRALEGTIRREHIVDAQGESLLVEGDAVWIVYDPASTSRQAALATDRGKLDELLGGWTADRGIWKVALVPALLCGVRWLLVASGAVNQPGQDLVAAAVHTGRARALRVRVAGVGRASVNRGRVLRLTAPEGERELLLERWADPDHVAHRLQGQNGWLYWGRTARDGAPAAAQTLRDRVWATVTLARRRANTGPRALDSAVLVLADGRCLRGRTPRTLDGTMAPGRAVERRRPQSCPEAQPVERHVLRAVRVRPLAVVLALPAVATFLAMLTVPLGDLTEDGPTNAVLLTLTVLASGYASYRAAVHGGSRR
ncbi:hypothetical protein MTQ01_00375 [Streptomyces sp. XM4193]|uniref:hypothetical protein n=1 Tax=Streptomyces sp. XM4193 TaxID=2929782 RepID=UPI001FF8870F|nr:hypothetical protein [Streptomyces sp. XM4193]MCK1794507.1 hypothetical protein [Streptomyces sp. XM4193]